MMRMEGASFPKVSIIIVNTNELHHLALCLPSIFQQTYPNFDVFVVDNASTDGSLEFVQQTYPKVKTIRNKTNLGYAGANNIGFRFATGELVAVLNPDTCVKPRLVARIGSFHADSTSRVGDAQDFIDR